LLFVALSQLAMVAEEEPLANVQRVGKHPQGEMLFISTNRCTLSTYNFKLFKCVNMSVWLPHVSKLQPKTSGRQPNVYTFSLAMICNIQAAKNWFLY
jgi:hypothetical protein